MSIGPTASTPTAQATGDAAPLVPTDITPAPVTVGEIAEFLRHLTELGVGGLGDDPVARAAFLHRKAELFTRLTADPAAPTSAPAPARHTP